MDLKKLAEETLQRINAFWRDHDDAESKEFELKEWLGVLECVQKEALQVKPRCNVSPTRCSFCGMPAQSSEPGIHTCDNCDQDFVLSKGHNPKLYEDEC